MRATLGQIRRSNNFGSPVVSCSTQTRSPPIRRQSAEQRLAPSRPWPTILRALLVGRSPSPALTASDRSKFSTSWPERDVESCERILDIADHAISGLCHWELHLAVWPRRSAKQATADWLLDSRSVRWMAQLTREGAPRPPSRAPSAPFKRVAGRLLRSANGGRDRPRQAAGRLPMWIVTMPRVIGAHDTSCRPASRMIWAIRSGPG